MKTKSLSTRSAGRTDRYVQRPQRMCFRQISRLVFVLSLRHVESFLIDLCPSFLTFTLTFGFTLAPCPPVGPMGPRGAHGVVWAPNQTPTRRRIAFFCGSYLRPMIHAPTTTIDPSLLQIMYKVYVYIYLSSNKN